MGLFPLLLAVGVALAPIAYVTPQNQGGSDLPSDAGSGTDADNFCLPGQFPNIMLDLGVQYYGFFFLPFDSLIDLDDHYGFHLQEFHNTTITMDPAPLLPDSDLAPPDYDLQLLRADCLLLAESRAKGNLPETIDILLEPGLYVVRVYVPVSLQFPIPQAASRTSAEESSTTARECDPMCLLAGYGIVIT